MKSSRQIPTFVFSLYVLIVSNTHADTNIHTTGEGYGTGSEFILTLYQKYISPIKGGNTCPMHPACSQYAKIAFANSNPALAYITTCDRLIRCGHNLHTYTRHLETHKPYDTPDPEVTQTYTTTNYGLHHAIGVLEHPGQEEDLIVFLQQFNEHRLAIGILYGRLFSAQDTTEITGILNSIGRTYLQNNDFSGFINFYHFALSRYTLPRRNLCQLDLQLAASYLRIGEYPKAIASLRLIPEDCETNGEKQFLLAVVHAKRFDWNKTGISAAAVPEGSPFHTPAQKLMEINSHSFRGELRSPALAGLLSAVLPGAGYLYTGKASTAFASLLVNTLFIWATAESIYRENYALGTCAGFIGLGWYLGNIQGSSKSALNWNWTKKNEKINDVLRLNSNQFIY